MEADAPQPWDNDGEGWKGEQRPDGMMRYLKDAGPRWYRRDGKQVAFMSPEFLRYFRDDRPDRIVARTVVLSKGVYVSTVHLGLDHSWIAGGGFRQPRPLIFETMAWAYRWGHWWVGGYELVQARYSTEAEAIEGHKRIVADVSSGKIVVPRWSALKMVAGFLCGQFTEHGQRRIYQQMCARMRVACFNLRRYLGFRDTSAAEHKKAEEAP